AAGLPAFAPLPSLADAENAALAGARDRLLAAWAARDRYRARAARLERLAEERRRAREARAAAAPAGASGGAAPEAPARRPALPAARVRGTFMRLAALNPRPTTEREYATPYELLVAVTLSAQATDVGVNKATRRLCPVANTPAAIAALGEEGLKRYINT